jgi:hypothetical protein
MNRFLMLFSPWKWARLCLKTSGSPRPRPIRRRPTFRPCLTVLEDRTLLNNYLVTLATDNTPNGGGQQDNSNPAIKNAGDPLTQSIMA